MSLLNHISSEEPAPAAPPAVVTVKKSAATKRYGVLRFISRFLKILAIFVLIIVIGAACLLLLGAFAPPPANTLAPVSPGMMATVGIVSSLVVFFSGFPYAMFIYAAGELIDLLIDVSAQTLRSAEAAERQSAHLRKLNELLQKALTPDAS